MTKKAKKPPGAAAGKAQPIAVLEKTGRSFGNRTVLSDVSVEVRAGEVLAIVGPNGGGKSTLLMLLAGLLRPTTGTVKVLGHDAHTLALSAAGSVGLVTARPGLYPLLTGRENLRYFGALFGLSAADVDAKAEPLRKVLALTNDFDTRVSGWSSGMQQKLSLVRALLLSPKLLLLDEPTANLDPVAAHALHTEVRARADAGLACVLATHDLAAAETFADRALVVVGTVKRELTFSKRPTPPAGPLLSALEDAMR